MAKLKKTTVMTTILAKKLQPQPLPIIIIIIIIIICVKLSLHPNTS